MKPGLKRFIESNIDLIEAADWKKLFQSCADIDSVLMDDLFEALYEAGVYGQDLPKRKIDLITHILHTIDIDLSRADFVTRNYLAAVNVTDDYDLIDYIADKMLGLTAYHIPAKAREIRYDNNDDILFILPVTPLSYLIDRWIEAEDVNDDLKDSDFKEVI